MATSEPCFEMDPRVDAAFSHLRDEGYVAGRFGDCASCGGAEAGRKAEKQIAAGVPCPGVVYYHDQNHDDVMAGRSLFIHFFAAEENGDDAAVGSHIADVFEGVGLQVRWEGDPNKCVEVVDAARSTRKCARCCHPIPKEELRAGDVLCLSCRRDEDDYDPSVDEDD